MILLDRANNLGHAVNRINSCLRTRSVRRPTYGVASPPDNTVMCGDDVETRRLSDDCRIRCSRNQFCGRARSRDYCRAFIAATMPKSAQRSRSRKSALLVNRKCHCNCRPLRAVSNAERTRNGCQHRGHRALHVASAAAIYAVISHFATEWIDRHAIAWHRVLVNIPQEKLASVSRRRSTGNQRDKIIAARMDLLPQPSQAALLTVRLQEIGKSTFTETRVANIPAHRIDAWNPN